MLFSMTAGPQNRFKKSFAQADSAFQAITKQDNDSLLLNKSIETIETLGNDTIKLRASYVALIYWKGYTDCMMDNQKAGNFDFKKLNRQIKTEVQSIKKQVRK